MILHNISCFQIINIEQEPLVYKKKNEKGISLFANQDIKVNTPICVYYGDIINKKNMYNEYVKNQDNYINNISPYLRDINENNVVNGKDELNNDNLNLCGVIVNDYCNIKNISNEEIIKYNNSKDKCNVSILETKDFPIYYSIKHIKKNEEILTHYGIHYWLLQNNVKPENLKEILNFI